MGEQEVEQRAEQRERCCAHCGRAFVALEGVGRPPKYCRRSCRQRAFEARRHQGDQDWIDQRVIGLTAELAALEEVLDRVRDAMDELRVDVQDDRVDAHEALARLEAAVPQR